MCMYTALFMTSHWDLGEALILVSNTEMQKKNPLMSDSGWVAVHSTVSKNVLVKLLPAVMWEAEYKDLIC